MNNLLHRKGDSVVIPDFNYSDTINKVQILYSNKQKTECSFYDVIDVLRSMFTFK